MELRFIVFLILTSAGLVDADRCPKLSSFGITTYVYCSDYCCSSYATYLPCCYNSYISYYHSYSIPASAIYGIVFGCLVVLGIIVAIIICCVCCIKRSTSSGGQIISNGQPMTTITTTGNHGQAPYVYGNSVASPTTAPPPSYDDKLVEGQSHM